MIVNMSIRSILMHFSTKCILHMQIYDRAALITINSWWPDIRSIILTLQNLNLNW